MKSSHRSESDFDRNFRRAQNFMFFWFASILIITVAVLVGIAIGWGDIIEIIKEAV